VQGSCVHCRCCDSHMGRVLPAESWAGNGTASPFQVLGNALQFLGASPDYILRFKRRCDMDPLSHALGVS